MTETMAYRPLPLSWQERERVRELQLWLDCMARCRECGELMPMQDFDERLNVCFPCMFERHYGALYYRRLRDAGYRRRRGVIELRRAVA